MDLDINSIYLHLTNFLVSQISVLKVFIILTTIGLIRVLLVVRKYARRRSEYYQLLPGNTYPWYDFVGDFRQLMKSDLLKRGKPLHAALLQMHLDNIKKYKKNKLFCYYASYVPVLFTWNAKVAEVLLQDKEKEGRNIIYKMFEPLFGTGLITSDYDKWKPRKKLLAPCFHADVLKTFMPVFNEQAQILAKYFRKKSNGDFIRVGLPLTLCSMEVLLQTLLGVKLDVQENTGVQYVQSIRSVAKLLVRRLTNFWTWPSFIYNATKQGKEIKFHLNYIREFTRSFDKFCQDFIEEVLIKKNIIEVHMLIPIQFEVIKEKKNLFLSQQPEENNLRRKALLDYLLELHLRTKELSEEDIREEVETFSAAGQGTTAASVSWTLYNIGLHKDIQEKIRTELDRVLGDDVERPIDMDDLNQLKYLDCVLKETKRIYPTVPVIPKTIGEDIDVCGYKVPKGTICLLLVYALHRDEEVFSNPENFDPDRFLPENSAHRHPYAYLPFSAGPRQCIGSKFVRMEEMVIVSTILRHFTIESIDQRDQVPMLEMTLQPATPIQVKFTPRR